MVLLITTQTPGKRFQKYSLGSSGNSYPTENQSQFSLVLCCLQFLVNKKRLYSRTSTKRHFHRPAEIVTMASVIKVSFFFLVLVHAFLLLSPVVHSDDDDENNLLQGINSYRKAINLPILAKHEKADCLADEIADDIEDQPCSSSTNGANINPNTQTQLTSLPKHLSKCKIDPNSTVDGVIMPVCVPKLVPTLVLTNYTHSPQFSKHLNNSRFTGIGVGSEGDWTVVVLATSTQTGSFANAATSLVSVVGFGHFLVSLFLGLSLVLVS